MIWFKRFNVDPGLTSSILYDENTFYKKFSQDLLQAKKEVIIESPFVTSNRMQKLMLLFQRLLDKGVEVYILTKHPSEYTDEYFKHQATNEILALSEMGIQIRFVDGLHRKTAIIDRLIHWEGSLNILSQSCSKEVMRRISSKQMTVDLIKFLRYDKLGIF